MEILDELPAMLTRLCLTTIRDRLDLAGKPEVGREGVTKVCVIQQHQRFEDVAGFCHGRYIFAPSA